MDPNHIFRSSGTLVRIFYTLASSMALYISVWNNVDIIRDRISTLRSLNVDNNYDFIVVGAGSAGSALAYRLSEKYNVLLLEVSGWSAGRGLGGSSNIDFMIHSRGHPKDYDNWANITGDSKWCYNAVLPFFKRIEDYYGDWEYSGYHGRGGPVRIALPSERLTGDLFVEAAEEYGYSKVDLNGRFTEGFDNMYTPIKNGRRQSAFNAYIKPIRKRKSLIIQKFSQVNKVLIRDDTKVAYGVEYTRHGRKGQALAKREVILSAGAIQSPKILMLSGIGKKSHLESLGIPVKQDSPSVGANLQDHVAILLGPFFVKQGKGFSIDRDIRTKDLVQWYRHGTGPFSTSTINAMGYVTSKLAKENGQSEWPDIQFLYSGLSYFREYPKQFSRAFNMREDIIAAYTKDVLDKDSFSILTVLSRPIQKGQMSLGSTDPNVTPLIDPHYLETERDVKVLIEGMKKAIDIVEKSKAFQGIEAQFTKTPFPGCEKSEFRSDEYFECWARQATLTLHDVVGTAAMGPVGPKPSVVDPDLRVIGVKNLRVIDCSVIPQLGVGNTNAIATMLGEKGADLILKEWDLNVTTGNRGGTPGSSQSSSGNKLNDKAAKILHQNTISSILMGNFNGKPGLNLQIKDFESTAAPKSDLTPKTSTTTTTTTTPSTTTTSTTTTSSSSTTTTSTTPSRTTTSSSSSTTATTVSTSENEEGSEKRGRSHESPIIPNWDKDLPLSTSTDQTDSKVMKEITDNQESITEQEPSSSSSTVSTDTDPVDTDEFVVPSLFDLDKDEDVSDSTGRVDDSVTQEETSVNSTSDSDDQEKGSVNSYSGTFGGTSFDDIEWEFPATDNNKNDNVNENNNNDDSSIISVSLKDPGEFSTGSSLVRGGEEVMKEQEQKEDQVESPMGRKVAKSTNVNSIKSENTQSTIEKMDTENSMKDGQMESGTKRQIVDNSNEEGTTSPGKKDNWTDEQNTTTRNHGSHDDDQLLDNDMTLIKSHGENWNNKSRETKEENDEVKNMESRDSKQISESKVSTSSSSNILENEKSTFPPVTSHPEDHEENITDPSKISSASSEIPETFKEENEMSTLPAQEDMNEFETSTNKDSSFINVTGENKSTFSSSEKAVQSQDDDQVKSSPALEVTNDKNDENSTLPSEEKQGGILDTNKETFSRNYDENKKSNISAPALVKHQSDHNNNNNDDDWINGGDESTLPTLDGVMEDYDFPLEQNPAKDTKIISPGNNSTLSIPSSSKILDEDEDIVFTDDGMEQTTISDGDDFKVISVMGDVPITNILFSSSSKSQSKQKNSQNSTVSQPDIPPNSKTTTTIATTMVGENRRGRNQSPPLLSTSFPPPPPPPPSPEETQTENNSEEETTKSLNISDSTRTAVDIQKSIAGSTSKSSVHTFSSSSNTSDTSEVKVSLTKSSESTKNGSIDLHSESSSFGGKETNFDVDWDVNDSPGNVNISSPSLLNNISDFVLPSTEQKKDPVSESTGSIRSTSVSSDNLNVTVSTTTKSVTESSESNTTVRDMMSTPRSTTESANNSSSTSVVSTSSSSSSDGGTHFDDIDWNEDSSGNFTPEIRPEDKTSREEKQGKETKMMSQGSQAFTPMCVPLFLSLTLGPLFFFRNLLH